LSAWPFLRRRVTRVPVLASLCALALAGPGSARTESCEYDAVTRAVTAEIAPSATAILTVVGDELWFGLNPEPCGAATTTNTDMISVAGHVGSVEQLVLDQRGGLFGPGATPEASVFSEIEIETIHGDADDTVLVYLTEGDDRVAAGQNGLSLNGDGDVDVTFSPGAFPLEIHALAGADSVNGRGGLGAGLAFLGPLTILGGAGSDPLLRGSFADDAIDGGDGDDQIQGNDGADVIDGAAGDDILRAGSGDDDVTGGPGTDVFIGVDGDDTFRAADGETDSRMNGGPGADTAYLDPTLDPPTAFVENLVFELTPLVVRCGSADPVWHRLNVAIQCTAEDAESGVPDPADRDFALMTAVPRGIEVANAATNTRRVCNGAGLCVTTGPIQGNRIDRKAPVNPSRVRSTDHRRGVPSRDPRITMAFGAAKDGGSGVDGFSFSWTKRPTSSPDRIKDREQGARRATSPTLGKGRWYFHIRTRDNVGNWSVAAHRGPYPIDRPRPRARTLTSSVK
jgi:hypothetical protein